MTIKGTVEPEQKIVEAPLVVTDKARRSAKWTWFLLALGFSALEISVLVFGNLTFATWKDWVIAAGAVFFPVLAVLTCLDLVNDWSDDKSDRVTRTIFIGIPLAVCALLLVSWMLWSFFGWIVTIPIWAAVIIILLILLLLRR